MTQSLVGAVLALLLAGNTAAAGMVGMAAGRLSSGNLDLMVSPNGTYTVAVGGEVWLISGEPPTHLGRALAPLPADQLPGRGSDQAHGEPSRTLKTRCPPSAQQ